MRGRELEGEGEREREGGKTGGMAAKMKTLSMS